MNSSVLPTNYKTFAGEYFAKHAKHHLQRQRHWKDKKGLRPNKIHSHDLMNILMRRICRYSFCKPLEPTFLLRPSGCSLTLEKSQR